ncbi:Ig-like domain-containing protein [Methanocella conradii]|uniref:Ig-like domain-containing protein n=1 Tax=Methanocella conradii TaxID=1175444 RepID=UPI0024B3BD30|nr:VWA domain-containing protein [Methanocella conradii]MDI6896750.1 VWA domain-containing protein [Methanocella conradii]
MAARTLIDEAPLFFIAVCGAILLAAWLSSPAHADQPTVSIEPSSNFVVNTDYNIYIILNDTTNGSSNKTITLSVTSPNSSITSPVTTNMTGYAAATFHTSTAAGYNNITATYLGINYNIPVYVSPGPPYSLDLTVDHELRLANGVSKSPASARLMDQYNNPISGAIVVFNIDGMNVSYTTDSNGYANIEIGPYPSSHMVNVTAVSGSIYSKTATILFLQTNNLFTIPPLPDSEIISTPVNVTVKFYLDLGNNVPAVGVPLTFIAYDPDFNIINTSTGVTNSDGIVTFNFVMSNKVGNNTITISNNDLYQYGPIKSYVIRGEGSEVSNIILSPDPASSVFADGKTGYRLNIWAKDSGGNAVKYRDLNVLKNGEYEITVKTDRYGYASVDIEPSRYVCTHNYTVYANNTNVSSTIFLSYIAGPPAKVIAKANPYVVASAEIATPPGSPFDVHETDIIGMVVDEWNHPLGGQSISFASLNTSLGNITGNTSGVTYDGSGEYMTKFRLGNNTNGTDITVGVPVEVRSGNLSSICNVFYTNDSFISVKTSINPKNNISVNDTINVSISVSGIGWKIRPKPLDVELIFDSSGSMNWYSTTVSNGGKPVIGTIPKEQAGKWVKLYDYYNDGSVKDMYVMLSSPYSPYCKYDNGWQGSFYSGLMVKVPGERSYRYGVNSGNENNLRIQDAPVGTYEIWGRLHYDPEFTTEVPPYYITVQVSPKRLGKYYDLDSAAKVAGRQFIDNMSSSDQVGVIWFNMNSGIARSLSLVNSTNKSRLYNAINGLNAEGGTNVYLGIQEAISDFDEYGRSNSKHVAIILSDGYSQSPEQDLYWAEQAKAKGITIYTIAMGMADEQTLGGIANRTGGKFYKVASDMELYGTYADISSDLKKIVANQTEMHILTSCSYVNGTLVPDAEYVTGSAIVTYNNNPPIQQEPIINTNGKYELKWNVGTIRLNDTWKVDYKLKVLKAGIIQPVLNTSSITYIREDGTPGNVSFLNEMMFVNDSEGGNPVNTTSKLSIKILNPSDNSKATLPQQTINWMVNYTGNFTYHQTITQNGPNGIVTIYNDNDHRYDGNKNSTYSYNWDSSKLPDGDYIITIMADDYHNNKDNASVTLLIRYDKGRIILE